MFFAILNFQFSICRFDFIRDFVNSSIESPSLSFSLSLIRKPKLPKPGSHCMRITIAKRLINNYSSRARLRSVRRSRAKFTSASDRSIISCLVERLLAGTAHTLYIANRDNGLSGYLSAVCARVADASSIVDIGNRPARDGDLSLQAFRAHISPFISNGGVSIQEFARFTRSSFNARQESSSHTNYSRPSRCAVGSNRNINARENKNN